MPMLNNIEGLKKVVQETLKHSKDRKIPVFGPWEKVPPISPEQQAAAETELKRIEGRIYRGNAATDNARARGAQESLSEIPKLPRIAIKRSRIVFG